MNRLQRFKAITGEFWTILKNETACLVKALWRTVIGNVLGVLETVAMMILLLIGGAAISLTIGGIATALFNLSLSPLDTFALGVIIVVAGSAAGVLLFLFVTVMIEFWTRAKDAAERKQ